MNNLPQDNADTQSCSDLINELYQSGFNILTLTEIANNYPQKAFTILLGIKQDYLETRKAIKTLTNKHLLDIVNNHYKKSAPNTNDDSKADPSDFVKKFFS